MVDDAKRSAFLKQAQHVSSSRGCKALPLSVMLRLLLPLVLAKVHLGSWAVQGCQVIRSASDLAVLSNADAGDLSLAAYLRVRVLYSMLNWRRTC
jgi:hypothetical protein